MQREERYVVEPTKAEGPGPDRQPGEPDTPKATKRGHVATIAVLVVLVGAGTLLLASPVALPGTVWGVLAIVLGALLLVLSSLVVQFYPKATARLSGLLAGFPERLRRAPHRARRALAFLVALVLFGGMATAARQLVGGPELEPGGLTIMMGNDQSPNDPRRILIDQWNETHPDNPVRIADVYGTPDEQHDRMKDDAQKAEEDAHEGADVYVLDNVWMSEFIRDNYIQPLDPALRTSDDGDFFDTLLATSRDTVGGKAGLWGLPLNGDAGLLFVRSDVTGVEPPARWEDYMDTAAEDALAAAKSRPENGESAAGLQAATAAQFGEVAGAEAGAAQADEILTVTALEAMWASKGAVVNEDGMLIYDQKGNVAIDDRARAGMRKLAASLAAGRAVVLDSSRQANEDEAVADFEAGRALFMRNWPLADDKLRDSASRKPLSFSVVELPHDGVLGGQNLAVARSTDRPRAAQALVEFLTSSASQLILLEVGGFAATRPDVYTKGTRPYTVALRTAIENARPRPVTPCYTRFSRTFRDGVVRALNNGGEFEPAFPAELATAAKDCPP